MMIAVFLIILVGLADAANARAYRCESADGNVTYSDTPCRPDEEARELRLDPQRNIVDAPEGKGSAVERTTPSSVKRPSEVVPSTRGENTSCDRFEVLSWEPRTIRTTSGGRIQGGVVVGGHRVGNVVIGGSVLGGRLVGAKIEETQCVSITAEWTKYRAPLVDNELALDIVSDLGGSVGQSGLGSPHDGEFLTRNRRLNRGDQFSLLACWIGAPGSISSISCR